MHVEALKGIREYDGFEAVRCLDAELSEAHCELCGQVEVVRAVFRVLGDGCE